MTIPNSVTSIGEYAFKDCTGLTSVTIPNSVTEIKKYAFRNCTSLTTVNFNATACTSTGYYSAFDGCSNLTTLNIGDNVTIIPEYTFQKCVALTSVDIPNSVIKIGSNAFNGCTGLTSVTIPNSVTSIGGSAFSGCTGLTSVTIPNSETSIGYGAFYGCTGLTSVTIPESVNSIGKSVFKNCTNITTINFNATNCTSMGDLSDPVFEGCSNLTTLNIGDNVTIIPESAFSRCTALTSVTIPNSVTSIGSYAFSRCTGLTSVDIPNSVTSISHWAFYNCTSLTSVRIPNSITEISGRTFSGCTSLTSVTIPNSVTSIGSYAFSGCTGLTSVTIPESVTSIASTAFDLCSNLKMVISERSEAPEISNDTFGDYVSDAVLLVPIGAKASYTANTYWSQFGAIIEASLPVFSAADVDYGKGKETDIVVELANDFEVRDFQCFVELPEGITPKMNGSAPAVEWAGRQGNHSLSASYVDGAVRIVAVSTDGSTLSGSEGALVKVPVVLNTAVGTYTASITNAYCSTALGVDIPAVDATFAIQVSNYPESITLNATSTTVYKGSSITLEATVLPLTADGRDVVWTTSDAAIATVDANGVVTGVSLGTVTITATTGGNLSATCQVEVLPSQATSVEMSATTAQMIVGDELALTATVLPTVIPDTSVTWSTSSNNIATVDANGTVTAVGPGVATITAKAHNGVAGHCTVTVMLLGDANADNRVAVGDVTTTVNHILGKEVVAFVTFGADVNRDGEVTLSDAVGIVNVILGTYQAQRQQVAMANGIAASTLTNATAEANTLALRLTNASSYVAMQFDVAVPAGVDIESITLGNGGSHALAYNRLDATTVRVVVYSLANAPLADDCVATITLAHGAADAIAVDITNCVAADVHMTDYHIADQSFTIGTTGIEAIGALSGDVTVYTVAGVKAYHGPASDMHLAPGLYIIAGKKVMIK